MAYVPMTQEPAREINRPVWVLNRASVVYKENFKGETIEIPPNQEKKITMPCLKANRFLSQGVPPAEQAPNGDWISIGKPLYIQELTDDELMAMTGRTKEELADERKQKVYMCSICGDSTTTERGLKNHIAQVHSEKGG